MSLWRLRPPTPARTCLDKDGATIEYEPFRVGRSAYCCFSDPAWPWLKRLKSPKASQNGEINPSVPAAGPAVAVNALVGLAAQAPSGEMKWPCAVVFGGAGWRKAV